MSRRWLRLSLILASFFTVKGGSAQTVWFVDGYHGGVYGHYPRQYTAFINEMMEKHPEWRINLELEPETWDSVQVNEPGNYARFMTYLENQTAAGRVEYVNPAYGQSYMYNINGESIIRQFSYGIRKMREHFPALIYRTYSSEEPCFTSALPGILGSFGFKYASLKNPNTCWGGYTRAFGGEMLNWVGPDGSRLLAVPRYASEALDPHSTWQTTASTNSPDYISTARAYGIRNVVGMCLQDAGWKFGPWLTRSNPGSQSVYTTWRHYFEEISLSRRLPDWNFSQEDVQVSLVWGSQVLQQIARQVRYAENKITRAEKIASMASVFSGAPYPHAALDEGWRGILLSQHHDCWIVPYNGKKNNTWIDKVSAWTATADRLSDSVGLMSRAALVHGNRGSLNASPRNINSSSQVIRVYNSNAATYNGLAKALLPAELQNGPIEIRSASTRSIVASQADSGQVFFRSTTPGTGFSDYIISTAKATPAKGSMITRNGDYVKVITDLYEIVFNQKAGGAIVSLRVKRSGKQFVDTTKGEGLNMMKGYFFNDSAWVNSATKSGMITILHDGPLLATLRVDGFMQQHPFSQTITMTKSGELIDVALQIDWVGNPGIGDGYKQRSGYKGEDYRKAFYDDSKKLQTLFPLALRGQQVSKNAPFDVTESKLGNTIFRTWDSIKNNVLLNWVDVTDDKGQYGFAVFTDHTTNYLHSNDDALGLTTQYSGVGLWGRGYSITGPTEFHYAMYPHAGNWEKAEVWKKNVEWNNEVETEILNAPPSLPRTLLTVSNPTLEITSIEMDGDDLLVRLFNPSTRTASATMTLNFPATSMKSVELDGRVRKTYPLAYSHIKTGLSANLSIRKFGIETIRIGGIKKL